MSVYNNINIVNIVFILLDNGHEAKKLQKECLFLM